MPAWKPISRRELIVAPATTGASDWPRTDYDNCNSNHSANTGYSCQ
jgi:hypothetical protein